MATGSPKAAVHQRVQTGYQVHAWGEAPTLGEFPIPRPEAGEVLVHVEACGVGLTVLNCMDGHLADDPSLLPRVPGHELVGRVVDAGQGAESGLVGRRVVAYFYLSCGTCPTCASGRQSRCERLAGWVGVHRDGGYAPWTTLPAKNAIPVPENLDPVAATVVPDAVATPVHVCGTRARVSPGDRVAVIGAGGGVGVHMVQVAALYGARVAGLDRTDDKLTAVERMGARPVLSVDIEALDPALWPDGYPNVVIDLVGSPETLRWSVDALGPGGRLVVLTTFPGRQLPIDPRDLVFRELTVLGSRYASWAEVSTAAALVASGRVLPVIGETVGSADLLALHSRLRHGSLVGRGALSWS
ncbi:MAG: alcohol dehydrogenase catalytic domain-containing protein [Nocardioidaceae bacterium]